MQKPSPPTVTFQADGLETFHNADFLRDPLFAEAYRLGINTGHRFGSDLHIEWRVFVCCWAAHHAKKLGGDFVECGVNTGICSRAVMHYIDFKSMRDRAFYLVDTFNGMPLEQLNEAEKAIGLGSHNAFYFDCYETVRQNFSTFPNVRIIRGVVPEVLSQIDTNNISYVSIDMNCVMPEIAAGRYLWPRLAPGAIVVLDDYGWMDHIQQKHAWDAFAAELDLRILAMPTGQGLLIKP